MKSERVRRENGKVGRCYEGMEKSKLDAGEVSDSCT